jgi:alkylation response protein AidB-like acyl-CoA dehydrogenase
MIVTRTDPGVPKHAGLTYFIVDMKSPGIEIRQIKQINGGRAFNEVFFTDVKLPDANRLSAVGNGWAVAITTLMHERASIGGGGSPAEDRSACARRAARLAGDRDGLRQQIADFTSAPRA